MVSPGPADARQEVLRDVARVLGGRVVDAGPLRGGLNGGARRVVVGGTDAVLKVEPLTHPGRADETARARRVVEQLRDVGYPTPAWLAVGATPTHGWQLTEFVEGTPAAELTPALIGELLDVVELQAGRATEPYDHWSYAWNVLHADDAATETPEQTRLRRAVAGLPGHSRRVADLVQRARGRCAGTPRPTDAPDVVHADLTPGNLLVRNGRLVGVVDVGNTGSGTRVSDLVTLLWRSFEGPAQQARPVLWDRIRHILGRDEAAVPVAAHTLFQLEFALRQGSPGEVARFVDRGHRCLDELDT